MRPTKGACFANCSDIKVIIHKIYFSNDKYMKCRIQLINIKNGIDYGYAKEKIYFENIGHWLQFEVA